LTTAVLQYQFLPTVAVDIDQFIVFPCALFWQIALTTAVTAARVETRMNVMCVLMVTTRTAPTTSATVSIKLQNLAYVFF